MTIRGNVRKVQELENSAAEKVGMRCLLIEEDRLLGKDRDSYISEFVARILEDIKPELLESAELGVDLVKVVKGAVE
jgi:predicted NACHT family NTPase